MAKKSYDKAFAELQQILEELQGDQVSIDKLSVKIKKATALLATCKGRLREVETELSSIDEEE
jgi:exodeoxyribonuclease VII small subunit